MIKSSKSGSHSRSRRRPPTPRWACSISISASRRCSASNRRRTPSTRRRSTRSTPSSSRRSKRCWARCRRGKGRSNFPSRRPGSSTRRSAKSPRETSGAGRVRIPVRRSRARSPPDYRTTFRVDPETRLPHDMTEHFLVEGQTVSRKVRDRLSVGRPRRHLRSRRAQKQPPSSIAGCRPRHAADHFPVRARPEKNRWSPIQQSC